MNVASFSLESAGLSRWMLAPLLGAVLARSSGTAVPTATEPVGLATAVTATAVAGKSFDLVVIGSTPSGIACAVRAAREGLRVLLTQHNRHVGGMLTNGLFQWDALYGGDRAPLFNEYAQMIADYYRRTYGAKSPQFDVARFTQDHYPLSAFEPSVAEREFNRLIAKEKNITLLLAHYPSAVDRADALLRSVTLRETGGTQEITVRAATFVDATYEGDLLALAKVPYRVGREGRAEYGEPHAGKLFTNIRAEQGPRDVLAGRLNLHVYAHQQGTIDPTSPATADGAIQAYNFRFCISEDPHNRRLVEKPANYRREEFMGFNRSYIGNGKLNAKGTSNSAILPGANHAYPEADWPTRAKIAAKHRDFGLGLFYFLQNDASIPAARREQFCKIGLALDEFPDNNNVPYEIYVREARRLVGRSVFTEQDNSPGPGRLRPPIHADSIAITDWVMDSHDCSTDRHTGFEFDGKLILTEESRPAQIPYRCLLPQGVDNLLVPVCLSATHVAWGAVRLAPVWMQVGEAAGFAAALALKHGLAPAALDPTELVRTLCEARCMVTFFNDVNVAGKEPGLPAAQLLGTRGFFDSYDARLQDPLTLAEATAWTARWRELSPHAEVLPAGLRRGEAVQRIYGDLQ